MAVKVTKGQISDGTISENTCIEDYYLCGKFHGFMKKCTIFWLCHYTKAQTSLQIDPRRFHQVVMEFLKYIY